MPKITKHHMLKEAKRIANIEFKDTKEEEISETTGLKVIIYTNAAMHRDREIERVCDLFDFDEDRFREMIKTFERNKEEYIPQEIEEEEE